MTETLSEVAGIERTSGVSVVIPAYGISPTLERCVRAAAQALLGSGLQCEIIVVDDCGPEPVCWRPQWAAPIQHVRVLLSERNMGFGGACNTGVLAAAHDRVMLLNSDMYLAPDSIGALLAALDSRSLAVCPRILIGDLEGPCESYSYPFVHRGVFGVGHLGMAQSALLPEGVSDVMYACGGAMLVWAQRFLDLGGFSSLFSPYYWEDADFGWRGWRVGWRSRCSSAARAVHGHGVTIQAQDSGTADVQRDAHALLFTRADIDSAAIRAWLAVWYPVRLMVSSIRRPGYLGAVRIAKSKEAEVAEHRASRRVQEAALGTSEAMSDAAILSHFAPMAAAGGKGRR